MKTSFAAQVHSDVVRAAETVSRHLAVDTALVPPPSAVAPIRGAKRRVRDPIDSLVLRASRGDRRAIGAVAKKLTPVLLKEARSALGDFPQEAEDIVQDLFVALLDGALVGAPLLGPRRGRALEWLKRIVRILARLRSGEREEDWGFEDDEGGDGRGD